MISRKKFEQEWREAIVNDEVRIATLERRVEGLVLRLKALEERVRALEGGRQ